MPKQPKDKASTPRIPSITQEQIKEVLRLETLAAGLRGSLKELQSALDDKEGTLMSMLAAGAKVEPGEHSARLAIGAGACRPPWKQIHIEHMATHGIDAKVVEQQAKADYPAADVTKLVIA